MRVDKINLFSLIIGVVSIVLAIWGWSITHNISAEKGLQEIVFIWGLLSWIISCVLTIIAIKRLRKHRKEVTFWIGFIINFLFCILGITAIILIIRTLFFVGSSV